MSRISVVLMAFCAMYVSSTVGGMATASDTVFFATPSGNIVCMMSDVAAACDVAERTWTGPAVPADQTCGGEADRISMQVGRPPALVCRSDTFITGEDFTLQYGQSHSVGALTCRSETSGVTCRDDGSGHYFEVSRDSYGLH